jgi:hypothetical protein
MDGWDWPLERGRRRGSQAPASRGVGNSRNATDSIRGTPRVLHGNGHRTHLMTAFSCDEETNHQAWMSPLIRRW